MINQWPESYLHLISSDSFHCPLHALSAMLYTAKESSERLLLHYLWSDV
jgi:hypothetical protein